MAQGSVHVTHGGLTLGGMSDVEQGHGGHGHGGGRAEGHGGGGPAHGGAHAHNGGLAHGSPHAHGDGHTHGGTHAHGDGGAHGDGHTHVEGHAHSGAHAHGGTHAHDGGHGHGHGHLSAADLADQAEVLDLDAELLAAHTADVIAWLPTTGPRQIVDLGAGTGAGTFALLAHFPEAHITAVDSSLDHLQRLREKAGERGVADRVHTVLADLDSEWPDLGAPDLIWASASLHHMADPAHTLAQLHKTLAPNGLLAVVELAGMPQFFPEQAPDGHDERLPHRGADWGPKLAQAGFTVEAERTITVHIERSPAVERYARIVLRRQLDPEGLEAALRRDDLALRTERTVWAARKWPTSSGVEPG